MAAQQNPCRSRPTVGSGSVQAAVAVGGALGALLRHVLEVWWPTIPWVTLVINISGAAAMGCVMALIATATERPSSLGKQPSGHTDSNGRGMFVRALVATGFLGGFTTFSTFAVGVQTLLVQHQWAVAFGYGIATMVGAVFLAGLGFQVTRRLSAGRSVNISCRVGWGLTLVLAGSIVVAAGLAVGVLAWAVAAGAALGALARWALSQAITRRLRTAWPVATLLINVLGSLVLGLITGRWSDMPLIMALLGIGVCGAFTTWSTAAFEVVERIRTHPRIALAYGIAGPVLSVGAAMLGWLVAAGG